MQEHDLVRELRRSEHRLRTALDRIADLIVLMPTADQRAATLRVQPGADVRPGLEDLHPDDAHEVLRSLAAIVEAIVGLAAALGCEDPQGRLVDQPVPAGDVDRVVPASALAPDEGSRAARAALVDATADHDRLADTAFRAVVDGAPDIVSTFDRNLRHIDVSPAAERHIGIRRADLIGRTNAELGMPPHLVRQWDAALRSVFRTGGPTELEYAFDGPFGRRWFTARLVPDVVDGRVVTVSAITRDVTDRRLASAVGPTTLDPLTGLLGRLPFQRLAGGVRHGDSGPFSLVRVRFDDDRLTTEAGVAVRAALQAGDLAARWSADEVVVLRHPAGPSADVDRLARRLAVHLEPHGAVTVDVRYSERDADSPTSLLSANATGAPSASGDGALDAAAHRPASRS